MRKIGVLLAGVLVLGGSVVGAAPVPVDYADILPATSEGFESYAPGTGGGSGPFDFDGFAVDMSFDPEFTVSVSDAAPCSPANQCLSVDDVFGDVFPITRFSGFRPGTASFGVRLLPGSTTDIFGLDVVGASGTFERLLLLPDRVGTLGFSDPAGLSSVTLGGTVRFDDVVTGIVPVPLPPAGLALVAALGGLHLLRRRPA